MQNPIVQVQQKVQVSEKKESDVIQQGDSVIVYLGINNMRLQKIKAKQKINLHFGCFQHDDIIGKKFGSKIISNKDSYIYVLKPSPFLITETLARKTQILFSMDVSAIIYKLNLLPGDIVVEAGTGSGSLSSSIATAIRENGHLYTFQFNKQRAEAVRQQFRLLKFNNITVTHRDVVSDGFSIQNVDYEADALFLDVPNPWDAIKNAKAILKTNGRICCFSPCIEQVQKTCEQLEKNSFKRIQTHQCLSRNLQRRQTQFTKVVNQTNTQKFMTQNCYTTGPKQIRGHTGYLTFAYL